MWGESLLPTPLRNTSSRRTHHGQGQQLAEKRQEKQEAKAGQDEVRPKEISTAVTG
jgi:hypothetical protein